MRLVRVAYPRGNDTVKPIGYTLAIVRCMLRVMFFSAYYIHSKEFGFVVQWLHYELVVPEVYSFITFVHAMVLDKVIFSNSYFEFIKYKNGLHWFRRKPNYVKVIF